MKLSAGQNLFNVLGDVCNFIALESEMHEILDAIQMDNANMKPCTKCNEVKPFEQFRPEPRNRNGINSRCKACDVIASQEWQARNPEKVKAAKRAAKMRCDVCGSTDVIEAPHMGKNCNRCHQL